MFIYTILFEVCEKIEFRANVLLSRFVEVKGHFL